MIDVFRQVMGRAERGELRIDTEQVALADVEAAWQRQDHRGRRLVLIP